MTIDRSSLLKALRNFYPLKAYFVQNRRNLAIGVICLLLVDFLQLLIPLVIKRAVDLLTAGVATPGSLLHLALGIVGLALLIGGFRYVWRLLLIGHSRRIEKGLRRSVYQHLQSLSYSFYSRVPTGDLMARAINDINSVRMATGMGLVALMDGTVLGISAIAFMMSINVKLTLISLIPMPVIAVLTAILTRRMSAGFETVQETFADLTERVRETLAGIRIIKAYARENWAGGRVAEEGERYISENMNLAKTLAFFFPMMAIFTNLGLAIVIWLGGRLTILGTISTGDFVAFISYLNLLTWPMMAMGWVTNLIQRGSASMRRINTILEEVPDICDAAVQDPPPAVSGELAVEAVSFSYPGQDGFALRDVDFHVRPGETVALVGRVGSGKSTLLRLIPRLLDPALGVVSVDGRPVREFPLRELRRRIGFIAQEVFLFSDTIENNVRFGREGISSQQLETALRTASILEEILALENGLAHRLGERGTSLSGGQRQRLTIARALLAHPPVLILDDALSMVDTQTEERILDRIMLQRRSQTNVIVSHRISTIGRADRIVVLDEGQIVEQGTHDSLLALGGVYSDLYENQLLSQDLVDGTDI